MNITEFLRARLDEDEAAARADIADEREYGCEGDHGWSPERVLAEVEAKRRIVERYKELSHSFAVYDNPDAPYIANEFERGVLRPLAAVYAAHPDYDPAWRP